MHKISRFWEVVSDSVGITFFFFVESKLKKLSHKQKAIALRKYLEKLGSVFIKFGQMLALRPDILPEVYCDELCQLLDQVPPFGKSNVEKIILDELKGTPEQVFSEFNYTPLASASFAQVHPAILKNGQRVAVKLQRPGIGQTILDDIGILKLLARVGDVIFKPANKFIQIVEEFEVWTKDELDYELEATNMATFNKFEQTVNDGIRATKVYPEYSTGRIITMELVEGKTLAQLIQEKHSKWAGRDGKTIVSKLIKNTLEMAHVHGFFHADPHPANIFMTKTGELVLIDFGIVGVLNQRERILILRYLRSMLSDNADAALEALLSLCEPGTGTNFTEVRKGYHLISNRLTATFSASTYLDQQKQSGSILLEAVNLLQRNSFRLPVSIVRYFKTFETIEGLIFALYPTFQVKDMAREFRRVSIINIVDALPEKIQEKGWNSLMLKMINSLEENLLLK